MLLGCFKEKALLKDRSHVSKLLRSPMRYTTKNLIFIFLFRVNQIRENLFNIDALRSVHMIQ